VLSSPAVPFNFCFLTASAGLAAGLSGSTSVKPLLLDDLEQDRRLGTAILLITHRQPQDELACSWAWRPVS
jgi:hypothetical protein